MAKKLNLLILLILIYPQFINRFSVETIELMSKDNPKSL